MPPIKYTEIHMLSPMVFLTSYPLNCRFFIAKLENIPFDLKVGQLLMKSAILFIIKTSILNNYHLYEYFTQLK